MIYLNEVQDFVEATKRLTVQVELGALFEQAIQNLGCRHFACMSNVDPLRPPKGAVGISNYPAAWAVHFSEQQYQFIDPIYRTCHSRLTPFFWSDNRWRSLLSDEQLNVLAEGATVGLSDGFTIPIHCAQGYPASCSIVFGPERIDSEAVNAIHLMAIYLYEALLRIKFDPQTQEKSILTPRQRECLELVAQGKSDWTIGQLLGISDSTVHFHIKSVFERLLVATRTQAIVKALFLGEIRFADVSIESAEWAGFPNLRSESLAPTELHS